MSFSRKISKKKLDYISVNQSKSIQLFVPSIWLDKERNKLKWEVYQIFWKIKEKPHLNVKLKWCAFLIKYLKLIPRRSTNNKEKGRIYEEKPRRRFNKLLKISNSTYIYSDWTNKFMFMYIIINIMIMKKMWTGK